MPSVSFDRYCAMLDDAKQKRFADPLIDVAGLVAAHRVVERYDVLIALHTDHRHPKNRKPFLDP